RIEMILEPERLCRRRGQRFGGDDVVSAEIPERDRPLPGMTVFVVGKDPHQFPLPFLYGGTQSQEPQPDPRPRMTGGNEKPRVDAFFPRNTGNRSNRSEERRVGKEGSYQWSANCRRDIKEKLEPVQ